MRTTQLTTTTLVAGMISACYVARDPFETGAVAQRAYIKPTPATPRSNFGYSVAVSADGSTLAVGATGDSSSDPGNPTSFGAPDSGAVHVFRRSGQTWTPEAYLKASRIVDGAAFGNKVALSRDGSILAVGASMELVDGCDESTGAAYVFVRQNGAWSEQQRFGLNSCRNEHFGASVSLSDDGKTLAVGIPGGQAGGDATTDEPMYPGEVHVYLRGEAGWDAPISVKVPGRSATTGDEFGCSVGLSGDGLTLAVGATMDASRADVPPRRPTARGLVYVSTRGAWAQLTRIDAPNADGDDWFGDRVALSYDGSTLVASARFEDGSGADPKDNLVQQSGAVHVFTRSGSTWTSSDYVKARYPGASDFFGFSIALSQDAMHLVVGAYGEDSSSTGIDQDERDDHGTDSGAAYVFANDGGTYQQASYVKASNSANAEGFGYSVAISADGLTTVVGAWKEGGSATGVNPVPAPKDSMEEGAVYVFDRIR